MILSQLSTTVVDSAAGTFTAPKVDYAAVLPMLIVFGAALASVLVEAFAPRSRRFLMQVVLTLVALIAALVAVAAFAINSEPIVTAGGAVAIDGPALFAQGTILALSIVAVLTMADQSAHSGSAFAAQASAIPGSPQEAFSRRANLVQSEVYPLLLLSIGGMLLFPAADDLLTMFVALEVLSLPLYLLCGLARRRRLLSQEASMKYFLLGAFSSAFFLYGAALLYGFAGTVSLSGIGAGVLSETGKDGLLLLGTSMLCVGLLFKVGAAPFQAWTPDVYQGAPTPITGFMAACTKVAAFGALMRVLYVALPAVRWDWTPALAVVAILTMVVGSVVAVVQADIKRMLAYSSIAHAGFILVGLLSMDRDGIGAVLFYLVGYGFSTIGAFALVTLVRTSSPEGGIGGEATHLSQWAGLGRRSPVLAGTFTLFLLAFAGIPLTSGFTGKFAVFSSSIEHAGAWGTSLAIVGVLSSAIAAFFYIRVIVLMYFGDPAVPAANDDRPVVSAADDAAGGEVAVAPDAASADSVSVSAGGVATAVRPASTLTAPVTTGITTTIVTAPGFLTVVAVGLCAVATLGLGVAPAPLLDLAANASVFLP